MPPTCPSDSKVLAITKLPGLPLRPIDRRRVRLAGRLRPSCLGLILTHKRISPIGGGRHTTRISGRLPKLTSHQRAEAIKMVESGNRPGRRSPGYFVFIGPAFPGLFRRRVSGTDGKRELGVGEIDFP